MFGEDEKTTLYPTGADKQIKQNTFIYLEGGKTLTIEEMEQALYEARNLIRSIGTTGRPTMQADEWLEKYFNEQ
ncbi:MAG: hypothetical protein M3209_00315 [Acidobacteriota bacterium]|nr:hypothetical protein [Acidobacteriota bacterium]